MNATMLVGAPGVGKTAELIARARAGARDGPIWLGAASDAGVARLRERLGASSDENVACASFADVAFTLLARARESAHLERIDDATAAAEFVRASAPLFELGWAEFLDGTIDPEITGLRAPERFTAATFRLIRKLRASLISPEQFKANGLRAATAFYGRPPNFAAPDLIIETHARHRDSLGVDVSELDRQYAREIDLIKIVTRLYETYVDAVVARGALTPIDAIYEASARVRDGTIPRAICAPYRAAYIDDAQDLTAGQIGLLEALAGNELQGITFAGDLDAATRGFATGARGTELFRRIDHTTIPSTIAPSAARTAILTVASWGLAASHAPPQTMEIRTPEARAAVREYRAASARDETHFIAAAVARSIADGVAPREIAIVVRNLACALGIVDALLARNIETDVGGAANLYGVPAAADALAALWAVCDPFRHDYLMRALASPWVGLADASIAELCGEPADRQEILFDLGDDDVAVGSGRSDRRRYLRLGANVTRGDIDLDLPPDARERLIDLRAALERFANAERELPLPALARYIFDETVAHAAPDNARGRFDRRILARVLDDIDAFAHRYPLASLREYLASVERGANVDDDLHSIAVLERETVRVLDVETVKGESFDVVFVPGLRAGAWPRYYVPDAFLYLPSLGMIAKENVGDGAAARTAKFTYAMYRAKLRDKYTAEERRAFYVAASRARSRLYVSAPGRPTRGIAAPEILAEIERARA